MVHYLDPTLDRTFAALGDPIRRALLARLEPEPAGMTVSTLAEPFPMSLPAILKHLKVLSDAGLITRTKIGRTVTCQLNAGPMAEAMVWLDRYQRFCTERLDRLATFVEEDTRPPTQPSQRSQASPSNVVSIPRPKGSTRPGPTRNK